MIDECRQIAEALIMDDMTERDFDRAVFAGASPSTLRGPRDAFTVDELFQIVLSESFKQWSQAGRDWVRNSLNACLT